MIFTISILATALSLASTNDYVYTIPTNIEITGLSSFGSDGLIRGEDAAFVREAMAERRAAFRFVSTNASYDARGILASRFNEIQEWKTNAIASTAFSGYMLSDVELPDVVVVNRDSLVSSFISTVGGVIPATNFDARVVSHGGALTNSNAAALLKGVNALSRFVFWDDGQTDSNGYQEFVSSEYSGEPPNDFNSDTGILSPGTLPPNTTRGDTYPGIRTVLGSLDVKTTGWRSRQQVWIGEWGDDSMIWGKSSSAATGPELNVAQSKYSVRNAWQAFSIGNAGIASATIRTVFAYAICEYERRTNDEVVKSGTVAVRLTSASADYSYAQQHAGYLPRIVITRDSIDYIFETAIETLGDSVVNTEYVSARVPTPLEPPYPSGDVELGAYRMTDSGTSHKEEQFVTVDSFIIVIDYDFNAKTL